MDGPVHAKDDRRARHAARERGRVADVYPPEPARAHRVQEHARDRRRAPLAPDLQARLREVQRQRHGPERHAAARAGDGELG